MLRVFQIAQFLSHQRQQVHQIYCIHPLTHWQREQRGATTTFGNWELQPHCGCFQICWTFVSDYTAGARDFLRKREKKCPIFKAQTELQKEKLEMPLLSSAESTRPEGQHLYERAYKPSVFCQSYAFILSKMPGALLIGTLKNIPPPLSWDHGLGNEPMREEQAPITISTAWRSYPSTNSTALVPYESKKNVTFGYAKTVKNNSVTEDGTEWTHMPNFNFEVFRCESSLWGPRGNHSMQALESKSSL